MLSSNFRLTKSTKNRKKLCSSFPKQIEMVTNINQEVLSEESQRNIQTLFAKYNLNFMSHIFGKATHEQKVQYLSSIGFRCCYQNEVILTLNHKKRAKQIIILLSGHIEYRIFQCVVSKKGQTFAHPSKPGQILNTPSRLELKHKLFSFVAKSDTIVMSVQSQSLLSQNIWKQKQQSNFNSLYACLQSFAQDDNKINQITSLMPFFTQCNFVKNQYISSRDTSTDCFCLVLDGEVEITRQSHSVKEVGIVQMCKGQVFTLNSCQTQNLNIRAKCKSLKVSLYIAPLSVLNQLTDPIMRMSINNQTKITQSIHSKIFKKSEKIKKDPSIILKKFKKKTKGKKRSCSLKQKYSWDLIDHFAGKMNLKQSSTIKLRQCRSTHISKASSEKSFKSVNVERWKKNIEKNQQEQEDDSYPKQRKTAGITTALKSPLKPQSIFLTKMNKTHFLRPQQENRLTLIKKTKYKLLRYAKGHNLYTLDDYF